MPRYSSKRSNKRRSSKRQMKGGDASTHALAVYGDMNNQHAISGTNIIAQNPVGAPIMAAPVVAQTGGNCQLQQQGGQPALAELAVPAVLLVANQMFAKKRNFSNKKRSTRRRRSNRKYGKQ